MLLGLDIGKAVERNGVVSFRGMRMATDAEFAVMRRDSVVYVSQAAELVGFLSIVDNMKLRQAFGGPRFSTKDCIEALKCLGVEHLAERYPSEISGGERQRCAIARCLLGPAPILIVDEPTSALDDESVDRVLEALGEVRCRGAAVLAASHDPRIADFADLNLALGGGTLTCS
jgi:putative ABC transport system ATP-binding protein